MYRTSITVLACFLFSIAVNTLQAQYRHPFYDEIQAFKKRDSLKMPPKHAILFVGSSSFRLWTNVQD
jgi:hypothetical protein